MYRGLMLRLLSLALVTLAAEPALASATPWQDIAPGVRARLIASDVVTDGHTLAGLELQMPEGTKTYWRIPGETGIPTEFDFSASVGVSDPVVQWTYPLIDRTGAYLDYIYRGAVVLPIEMEVGEAPASLAASIVLGICSDMCVPASATFSLPMNFATPDAAQGLRLRQAMAETPSAWDQPRPPFAEVAAGPDGSLHLEGPDPSIDPDSVIADLGDPALLFEAPQKSRDGNVWTLRPRGTPAKGLEGYPIQLTFMTPDGPYSVTRIVAPFAP
jgi:DsbC/DsbD-like thiol-disulfide interchange protein